MHPYLQLEDSFGLPQDSYDLACNMLSRHSRHFMTTLRERFTLQYLPELCTSRVSQHRTGTYTSLPGIGSNYWKTARAHNDAGSMPPGFPKSITEPAIEFDMTDVHNAIGHLKTIVLSEPGTSWNTAMWIAAVVKLDSDIPLIHIPVFSLRRRIFQDESPITVGHDFFHGTREQNLSSILHCGIHASPCSHHQVGTWVNKSMMEALNWTPTVADLLPTLALSVYAPVQAIFQNAEVAAGNYNRYVIRPSAGQILPAAQITSIIAGIPSAARFRWWTALQAAFRHIFRYIAMCELPHTLDITQGLAEHLVAGLTHRLQQLVSQRLAYGAADCLSDLTVGTSDGPEYVCISHLSAAIASILWILQLESINNRRHRLMMFDMTSLPMPFHTFLKAQFPGINLFVRFRTLIRQEWTLGPTSLVHKVGRTSVEPWTPWCAIHPCCCLATCATRLHTGILM